MSKVTKDFSVPLSSNDVIDVRIMRDKNRLTGFVLNLRSKFEDDVWYQIYRVDTCHDYLHEQRFWITPEPIPLPRYAQHTLGYVFEFFMSQIKENYRRYRRYYKEKMRGR